MAQSFQDSLSKDSFRAFSIVTTILGGCTFQIRDTDYYY